MLRARGWEGKYTPTQKQKSATAVHLPFEELEPVHLAFELPVAPGVSISRRASSGVSGVPGRMHSLLSDLCQRSIFPLAESVNYSVCRPCRRYF